MSVFAIEVCWDKAEVGFNEFFLGQVHELVLTNCVGRIFWVIFYQVVILVEDSESIGSDIWVGLFSIVLNLPVLVGLGNF